jgi:NTP pyrophosphatase (non-canonical NTP hydrolase)
MSEFKVGDLVRCVDNTGCEDDLVLHAEYIVEFTDAAGISFDPKADYYDWYDYRFELVRPAEQVVQVLHHPQLVAALVKPGKQIVSELTGSDTNLLHMVIGISGEAGELLDAIKKAVIYRKELDRNNVIEELGDIEFYLEGLRQELGLSREECLAANVAKLQKRYGDKYSDSAAQIRADKEQS